MCVSFLMEHPATRQSGSREHLEGGTAKVLGGGFCVKATSHFRYSSLECVNSFVMCFERRPMSTITIQHIHVPSKPKHTGCQQYCFSRAYRKFSYNTPPSGRLDNANWNIIWNNKMGVTVYFIKEHNPSAGIAPEREHWVCGQWSKLHSCTT